MLGYALDRDKRGFSRKVENAERKRVKKEQFAREFSKRPFYWTLRDMLDTEQVRTRDIQFISEEGSSIDQVVAEYKTERGIEITLAILDLPARRNVQT